MSSVSAVAAAAAEPLTMFIVIRKDLTKVKQKQYIKQYNLTRIWNDFIETSMASWKVNSAKIK